MEPIVENTDLEGGTAKEQTPQKFQSVKNTMLKPNTYKGIL